MKVGKTTAVLSLPYGVIIYATNMVPVTVHRFGRSDEQLAEEVREAAEQYEIDRKKQTEKYGELP